VRYFSQRCRNTSVFEHTFLAFQVRLGQRGYIEWDLWCIEVSNVRVSWASARDDRKVSSGVRTSQRTARRRNRGGFGAKFHLVTDDSGLPLAVEVTVRRVHRSTRVEGVMRESRSRNRALGRASIHVG